MEILTNIFLTSVLIFIIDFILIRTDFFRDEKWDAIAGLIAFVSIIVAIICLFAAIWI